MHLVMGMLIIIASCHAHGQLEGSRRDPKLIHPLLHPLIRPLARLLHARSRGQPCVPRCCRLVGTRLLAPPLAATRVPPLIYAQLAAPLAATRVPSLIHAQPLCLRPGMHPPMPCQLLSLQACRQHVAAACVHRWGLLSNRWACGAAHTVLLMWHAPLGLLLLLLTVVQAAAADLVLVHALLAQQLGGSCAQLPVCLGHVLTLSALMPDGLILTDRLLMRVAARLTLGLVTQNLAWIRVTQRLLLPGALPFQILVLYWAVLLVGALPCRPLGSLVPRAIAGLQAGPLHCQQLAAVRRHVRRQGRQLPASCRGRQLPQRQPQAQQPHGTQGIERGAGQQERLLHWQLSGVGQVACAALWVPILGGCVEHTG